MRQKLFKKYFFATGLLVIFCLAVIMAIMAVAYKNQYAASKYDMLDGTCGQTVSALESRPLDINDTESFTDAYGVIKMLSSISGADHYITDKTGIIRICYCEEWKTNFRCEHTGTQIKGNFIGSYDKYRGVDDLGMYPVRKYVVAHPVVYRENNLSGYVVAVLNTSSPNSGLARLAKVCIISAILPVTLMFAALYVITYRLTKPLKLMSEASKAMAKGDFSRRIPVTSDDEIGELAVSFNQMTNSLARLEGMRKSFVADVSHELKTPMTTIGGFIDGIIDGTIDESKEKYYLGIVSEEVKRLSRMVESMLSLSRLESDEFLLRPEKFDFKDLLLNVVISQEQRIEKKELKIEGLDSVCSATVYADRDLIHRVIYNLVDNAIKFTDNGGKLTFKLDADAKNVIFTIKNTGKGIPKAELPYVFERFYKVDKSRSANKKSTGLGLYIVKTIVKKHNGTITVKSVENEYAEFSVILPLAK